VTSATRRTFAVTWDYRCPFARNAHEHVLAGLRAGAPWDVAFQAFSLGQVHVAEGEPDIWDHPADDTGVLALQAGVVVRDQQPDRFLDAHEALFALRHDHGGQLRDEGEVRATLDAVGVDVEAVFDAIASGEALETVRKEHEDGVASHQVWGVPTFIVGEQASFVRLMDRPKGDGAYARSTIDRVVDLLEWPNLNKFKHTSIPR
jgi:DSBA-like thioredoxin domain-containing protein